jgi:hypothetical protein
VCLCCVRGSDGRPLVSICAPTHTEPLPGALVRIFMQHIYDVCAAGCVRIVRDLCDAPNMKAVIIRVIYLLLLLLLHHSCPLVRSFLLQSSCQVLSTLFRSAPGISARSEKLLAFCLACFVYFV